MHALRFAAAAVLAVAFLSFNASGQPAKQPPKDILPPGWKDLELTDAQKAEVFKINREAREAIDKLEDEIKKLKAEQVKKRIAVLTDKQRKLLRESVGGSLPSKDKELLDPPAKEKK